MCHEFLLDVRIQETDCDIVICEKPLCAMVRKWLKQNTSNYSDFFVFKVEKKALNGQFEGVYQCNFGQHMVENNICFWNIASLRITGLFRT